MEGDTIFYVGSEEGEMPALCQMWGAEVVMFEPNDKVWPNTKVIWDANKLDPPLACFSGFASNRTSSKAPLILGGFPESANGEVIHDHGFKEVEDQEVMPEDHWAYIPEIKIDDLVEQQGIIPTALTMDVEGSEWEVLQGAEQTLRKYKPKIWLSLHPEFLFRKHEKYSYEVRRWLIDMGYTEELLDYQHEVHLFYK
jgi:FkbM family methyltransferase